MHAEISRLEARASTLRADLTELSAWRRSARLEMTSALSISDRMAASKSNKSLDIDFEAKISELQKLLTDLHILRAALERDIFRLADQLRAGVAGRGPKRPRTGISRRRKGSAALTDPNSEIGRAPEISPTENSEQQL